MGQRLQMMKDIFMEVQLMRSMEGLSYVLLLVSQMGSVLLILVKIHWGDYLVRIVYLRESLPVGYQMVILVEVDFLVKYWEPLLGSCFGYIMQVTWMLL